MLASLALTGQSVSADDHVANWRTVHVAQPARPAVEQSTRIRIPKKDCPTLEELGYRTKSLTEIGLDISLKDERLPADCSINLFAETVEASQARRNWAEMEFNWEPSELYHQPVYFEDALLERYGQSRHPLVQPLASGAHFFAMFPIMPYKLGLDGTHDHIYTLGYYRPGSYTPRLGRRLPLNLHGAGLESAAWVGLFLLFP